MMMRILALIFVIGVTCSHSDSRVGLHDANLPVVDVFIRHYRGDADFLGFSLRSLDQFGGRLFRAIHILVPKRLQTHMKFLERWRTRHYIPRHVHGVEEFTRDFNQEMHDKLCADQYSNADFIYHHDPDVVVTRAVHLSDLFSEEKKPWLPFRRWETTAAQLIQPKLTYMLNMTSPYSFMPRHGLVFPRAAYALLRERVHQVHKATLQEFFSARGDERVVDLEALGLALWSSHRDLVTLEDMDGSLSRAPYHVQVRPQEGMHQWILYLDCLLTTGSPGPIPGPKSNATAELIRKGEVQNDYCKRLLAPELKKMFSRG
eukprot:RCo038895